MLSNYGSVFIHNVRQNAPIHNAHLVPFTGIPDPRGRCPRCHIPLPLRRKQSLQKCWASLIASLILLFPANLMPISIIYVNGTRQEDTILSGIVSLAHSNIAVAGVVFIASIHGAIYQSGCAVYTASQHPFQI